ncbi:MFS transporter [Paenibacillus tritici]|uniref:MFS transporter n=1 Tax=Paenibacillus tritici TaxID=1873425 RepID=A0ABX2DTJ1_9BACL|nr:glycoside-pentoside-hexuronide (GPH):cation symporter [Paenibacillus tritici]NQX47994.1 MFS transporter [Paenibacillus tritici]
MKRELTNRALLGDAMGQFGLNIASGLLGLVTYYYTDIVGVAAGLVGTIMLLTKVIDAGADVAMGVMVDRTRSKHGQARPWLLWMTIPLLISTLLIFSVPNVGATAKITFAVVTNLLFFVGVYTPLTIPYGSLMALTTKNSTDRSLMGAYRAGFGYLGGMITAIAFLPIVNAMGGGRTQWTILAVIFGVIASGSVYIAFRSTKEKYSTTLMKETGELKKSLPFQTALKLLFKNKYWLIIFFVSILANILFALSNTAGMYYAKYVWGNVNLVSIMGAIGLIPTVLIFLLSGPSMKRFGRRNTALIGLVIGIIGLIIRLIDPTSIVIGLVGSVFQSFGMIPLMVVMSPLGTDTIEYGEWKHGQRIVGLTNSVNSFGAKMGMALGTALIGWLLAWGHYNESASVQPDTAKQMIIVFNIYIPLIVYICIAVLLLFFSLEKQYTRILDDLEQRKQTII